MQLAGITGLFLEDIGHFGPAEWLVLPRLYRAARNPGILSRMLHVYSCLQDIKISVITKTVQFTVQCSAHILYIHSYILNVCVCVCVLMKQ